MSVQLWIYSHLGNTLISDSEHARQWLLCTKAEDSSGCLLPLSGAADHQDAKSPLPLGKTGWWNGVRDFPLIPGSPSSQDLGFLAQICPHTLKVMQEQNPGVPAELCHHVVTSWGDESPQAFSATGLAIVKLSKTRVVLNTSHCSIWFSLQS